MLKLTGQFEHSDIIVCPQCSGRGRVAQPATCAVRSGVNGFNHAGAINVPGTGSPIPCPLCRGRKVITKAQANPSNN